MKTEAHSFNEEEKTELVHGYNNDHKFASP